MGFPVPGGFFGSWGLGGNMGNYIFEIPWPIYRGIFRWKIIHCIRGCRTFKTTLEHLLKLGKPSDERIKIPL